MAISTSVWLSLGLGCALILCIRWYRCVRDLPPGPFKLPIVGNMFSIPTNFDSRELAKIGKKYNSEILYFEALGNSIVVLNSRRVAEELLEKRSSIYSSRANLPMVSLSDWDFMFILMPYGERWKTSRKIFTQFFSSPDSYEHRITSYVHKFLRQLLESPEDYFTHIRHLPGSIALDMTYGMKVKSSNDLFVKLAEDAAGDVIKMLVKMHLVDAFPVLKYIPAWFPGAGFQRRAALSRQITKGIREKPFEAAVDLMRTGRCERSLVSASLEEVENESIDLGLLKGAAGSVYLAASETSASSIGTFFLAMVTHPDVQRKAQQELDSILHGTLPTHQDISSLPYLTAVALEVYRWRPVTPIGVPHANTSNDVFEDYRVPAGSMIIANQWHGMLHDESDYPNPDTFNPERFLTEDGQLDPSVQDPMEIIFGFGRRICPGRHVAHSTVLLMAASVLSIFDLGKKIDADGNVIEPKGEYRSTMADHPLEFPCTIKPRSQRAQELILSLSEE